jgi:DNA-binding response OmpR family regulator
MAMSLDNVKDNNDENASSLGQQGSVGTHRGIILVVDDDLDVLFTLTTVLRDAGYVVDSYDSPSKALANYKPGTYDLLILDVKMPEVNGFELYRNIKARDKKAKVCFLTAGETYFSEFMRLFPELDENNYILKPVENQQLLRRTLHMIRSDTKP